MAHPQHAMPVEVRPSPHPLHHNVGRAVRQAASPDLAGGSYLILASGFTNYASGMPGTTYPFPVLDGQGRVGVHYNRGRTAHPLSGGRARSRTVECANRLTGDEARLTHPTRRRTARRGRAHGNMLMASTTPSGMRRSHFWFRPASGIKAGRGKEDGNHYGDHGRT